jgi:hypothetical protein
LGGETRLVLERVPVPDETTLLIEREVARRLAKGSTIVLLVVARVLAALESANEADDDDAAFAGAGVAGTE